MRNHLFLMSALLIALFSGCGESKSTDLRQEREAILKSHPWRVDPEASLAESSLEKMSGSEREVVESTLNNLRPATITFRPDSIVAIQLPDRTVEGVWVVREDGKAMLMQMTKVYTAFQEIEIMNDTIIKLLPNKEAGHLYKRIFVPANKR
jgi:hypothetical protein